MQIGEANFYFLGALTTLAWLTIIFSGKRWAEVAVVLDREPKANLVESIVVVVMAALVCSAFWPLTVIAVLTEDR